MRNGSIKRWSILATIAGILFSTPAEASPRTPAPRDCGSGGDRSVEIYVSHYARHSGIIIPVTEFLERSIPEVSAAHGMPYVEFGWGDRQVYTSRAGNEGLWVEIMSLFVQRPVVINLQGSDKEGFLTGDPLPIRVSRSGFLELIRFIDQTFDRDSNGESQVVGRVTGFLTLPSTFYAARNVVPGIKSCHKWTAMALQRAGCAIAPAWLLDRKSLHEAIRSLPVVSG